MDIRDVAPGLWVWAAPHPDWRGGEAWEGPPWSTCVESRGEVLVLDALAPEPDEPELWARLDARPPTVAVVLKPDHLRHVDTFAERYRTRAFGPWLYFDGTAPKTDLEPLQPTDELPGGLVALYEARFRMETPLWLPEQRTIVFADALTAPEGELRVWHTPYHEHRVVPALREMLELPFDRVIVSHGEPVHDRDEFERALTRPTWAGND